MTQPPHLALIIAAAGFGKSTALDTARPRDGVVRSARAGLEDGLPSAPWVGIDDLHELTPDEQLRLTAAVGALPRSTSVVITSRRPLEPRVRASLRGRVRERGPADLALSPYAVHRVLADEYAVADPEVPLDVHALTAGWPALVHFAAEALARNPAVNLREALVADTAPAAYWLREEILPTIPADVQRALADLAGLGPTTRGVCGLAAELEATGIVTALHGIGREGLVETVPVVAQVLATATDAPSRSGLEATAKVLETAGLAFGAARACVRAGDARGALRLVAERGDEMLHRGDAAGVVELVEAAPEDSWPDGVRQTYADALRICGDLTGAARAFRPLAATAESTAGWTPALAARVAAVHYASGRLEQTLQVLGEPVPDGADAETVEWIAARVHVLCSLGRSDEAVGVAAEALALADATGDPRALTPAHLAMARISSGERKEAHHEVALRAATEAGDVITASRILVNHSFQLLATARFDEAGRAARAALQAADVGIATGRRAAALHNLAEALMQLGEYDEAAWHLNRATAICRRLGIGRTALGLLGLAEIDRHLCRDDRAGTRYLEAVELARGSGEAQVLVPALAGLARLHAFGYDEPEGGLDRARAAADEATAAATDALRPVALTAAGWVALRGDDRTAAAVLARSSVAAAREIEAFDLLADALELAAACTESPDEARSLLTEALAIWSGGGARPPALRIELQLGRLPGADATARSRGRDAARELQRLGVRHVNGQEVSTAGAAPVQVEVLGGFRVRVDDAEVPVTAWRSRQARTLVKLLAGRRGRPVTRAWLCETLWPDDDPAKTGHRLSVLLATVRGVLDPEKRWPTDRFIAADLGGVWLDLRHVSLDAETLVRDAEVAATLMDDGEIERAGEILADINARYRGDAFEDEPGEEWADGVREEVRAAWQRSVRRLAALARKAGRVGDAQTLLVRLLVADPYDEKIHELLVKSLLGAGRRGEARRAFERWREAMREIGAPPPDPAFLGARPVVTPY